MFKKKINIRTTKLGFLKKTLPIIYSPPIKANIEQNNRICLKVLKEPKERLIINTLRKQFRWNKNFL